MWQERNGYQSWEDRDCNPCWSWGIQYTNTSEFQEVLMHAGRPWLLPSLHPGLEALLSCR